MANGDKLDRVPPYIPIIWQDWDSSMDVQGMSLTEEAIFFRFVRRQWVLDELPADPWKLAKLLGVSDYRTVLKFLSKYEHLFVGSQKHNRKCTVQSQDIYSKIEVNIVEFTVNLTEYPDISCECPVTVLNLKLKNLKNDVKSKLGLGTTEQRPEPELEPTPEPIFFSLSKDLTPTPDECMHVRLSEDKTICLDCGKARTKKKGVGK